MKVNHNKRNLVYGFAAGILVAVILAALWVGGVFSSSSAYACNVKTTEEGHSLVVSLTGSKITSANCADVTRAGSISGNEQIANVPSAYKLACTGTEHGIPNVGDVTVRVYTDGSSFSAAVGSVYCGQLDKTG